MVLPCEASFIQKKAADYKNSQRLDGETIKLESLGAGGA